MAESVDTHVHIWPRGLVHPLQRRAEPLNGSVADLHQVLARNNVSAAVACPATVYPDNEELIRIHESNPWVLPVLGIDPADKAAMSSIAPLAARGAVGVRIRGAAVKAREVDRLSDLAARHDLVLQWAAPFAAAPLIERAAARHRGLRQVIEHLGLPTDITDLSGLTAIRAIAAIDGVAVKLSGMYALSHQRYPYQDCWDWIAGVVEAFSPARVMWACDWPLATQFTSYRKQLAIVDALPFLSEKDRDEIRGGTARRFWKITS
jgi:L-fuconolactonase